MASKRDYPYMPQNLFYKSIVEEYRAKHRYCFILGSGASVTSGVRMGRSLMLEWRNYLSEQGDVYIRECAGLLEMDEDRAVQICRSSDDPKSEDYFDLFDLRFANRAEAAFQFLENEMYDKFPSIGYFALAAIMQQTDIRLLLTTNFDSLTEDALYLYHGVHPLVVGHESLAGFMGSNMRRPVVAKLHRDLYYRPMNRKNEMAKLHENWKKPLLGVLSNVTPIVVGYAGADDTLMKQLESDELQLKGIYWCVRRDSKTGKVDEPSERVKEMVRKRDGYIVEIAGFDECMVQMAYHFLDINQKDEPPIFQFKDPRPYLKNRAKEYCSAYQEQKAALDIGTQIVESITAEDYQKDEIQQGNLGVQKALGQLLGDRPSKDEQYAQLVREGDEAYFEDIQYETAAQKYKAALDLKPDDARLCFRIGYSFQQTNGSLEEAISWYSKAIELDPDYAFAYNNRGNCYGDLHRYEEALVDHSKAIELDPDYAFAYNNRGIAYRNLGLYEKALADYSKAIELKSDYVTAYRNRAILYDKMKQPKKAAADRAKADALEKGEPVPA